MKQVIDVLKLKEEDKKIYILLALYHVLFVLPIILADFYYHDDLSRALKGATGWNGDGRPMTEKLMVFFSGNSQTVLDLFPLPIIIASIIFAYVLVLYSKVKLSQFDLSPGTKALFLSFVIQSPFLLYNLSYRFDVLSMIIALSVAFIPWLIVDDVKQTICIVITFVTTLILLCTYQPALGMIICLGGLEIIIGFAGESKVSLKIRNSLVMLITAGVSAIFYKIAIVPRFVAKDDWRGAASQTVSFGMGFIPAIIGNTKQYIWYIFATLSGFPIIYRYVFGITIALIFIGFIVINLFRLKNDGKGWTSRLIKLCVIISVPILVFVGSFVPLTVLSNYSMCGRIMISFTGFMLCIGAMGIIMSSKKTWFITVSAVFMSLFSLAISYEYGNALKAQKEYETLLAHEIIMRIDEADITDGCVNISIVGNAPRARQVKMMTETFPNLNEMVPANITNSSWLGGAWLQRFTNYQINYIEVESEEYKDQEPVMSNMVFDMYKYENVLIVNLKE